MTMLTLENMGPVLDAYRQDLRDMEAGNYTAPRPASWMTFDCGDHEKRSIAAQEREARKRAARRASK